MQFIFADELPELYYSSRAMGMGGAFTAIANDDSAIWYNPAGVARFAKPRARFSFPLTKFPNLTLGVNSGGKDFWREFASGTTESSVSAISEAAAEGSTKPVWGLIEFFPLTSFKIEQNPTAFGLYSNSQFKIRFVTEGDETLARVVSQSDAGASMTMAFTNRSQRFSVGVQLRTIYRYAYEDSITPEQLGNKTEFLKKFRADANTLTGFAIDAGLLYTVPDFWFPTIGLAILNAPIGCKSDYLNPYTKLRSSVCGTTYTGTISNPDALSVMDPTDLRAGLSITPRITKKVNLRFAVDGHHMYATDGSNYYGLSGVEPIKQVHGGVELFWGNPLLPDPFFSCRVGASQGLMTSGASLALGSFLMEFATFGTDISSDVSTEEDRRYVGSFGFSF